MRFITEDDLRKLYKESPFHTYTIERNTRLTPGAKQFLNDFRIKLVEKEIKENSLKTTNIFDKKAESNKNTYSKRLAIKLKKIAFKMNKIDKQVANELNGIAITLFQGIQLSNKVHEEKIELDLEKLMFVDLNDEKIDVAIELINFDMELKLRIKNIIRDLEKIEDVEKKNKLKSYLNTSATLRYQMHLALEKFIDG